MSTQRPPMDKDKIIDEIGELKLKLAMTLYAEYEGKQLLKENEALKNDPFYQPSEEAMNKFKKLLNRHYFLKKASNLLSSPFRNLNRVAAAFSIIFILFLTSVFTVQAVRVKVLNLFISMQDKYTEIRVTPKEDSVIGNNLYVNWDNAYAPTDIPEGYRIQNLINGKNFKSIEYGNKNQDIIQFQQSIGDWHINVDTEDANRVEKISIQGHEGLLVEKNGLITVVWSDQSNIFTVISDSETLKSEDTVRIAESVTLIK